jgi:hypothetical protein
MIPIFDSLRSIILLQGYCQKSIFQPALVSTCPVTARLLELYQECMENGVWACVLYEAHDGIEKLTFLSKMTPPSSRQPG